VEADGVARRDVAVRLHVAPRALDRASGKLRRGSIALRIDRERHERLQHLTGAGQLAGAEPGDDASPKGSLARAAAHLPCNERGRVACDLVERLVEHLLVAERAGRAVNGGESGADRVRVASAEDGARELQEGAEAADCDPEIVDRLVVRGAEDTRDRPSELRVERAQGSKDQRARRGGGPSPRGRRGWGGRRNDL